MIIVHDSIIKDEGYYFGLGAFETIAVEEGRALFLKEHLQRLRNALITLGIPRPITTEPEIEEWLSSHPMEHGALKITTSKRNLMLEKKPNSYTKEEYEQGYKTDFSQVRRNSTSPLTYIKSLNYGDNILEKRKAKLQGIQEPIFLNEKGEISEGAVSNIYFVKEDGSIVTPALSCGLLPGIVREVLLREGLVQEEVIYPEILGTCKEAFLSNSLMGIMPLSSLSWRNFHQREVTEKMMEEYKKISRVS